jgi:Zn-dependent protease
MFSDLSVTTIVMIIVAILVSLTVHEMMHALAGFKLGDDTAAEEGRISLNPVKHIDPLMTVALPVITTILPPHSPILAAKPVPFNPERVKWDDYGAALIAAAGPLSNLVLAIAGTVLLGTLGIGGLLGTFLVVFITINVSLFVFNLVPVPPLDGSRVLYAFAPDGVRNVMDQLEPYGLFIVFGLILVGGFAFLGGINGAVLDILQRLL